MEDLPPQKVTGLFDTTFSQNKLLRFWFTLALGSILRTIPDPVLLSYPLRNALFFLTCIVED